MARRRAQAIQPPHLIAVKPIDDEPHARQQKISRINPCGAWAHLALTQQLIEIKP
ncbi:MAG: hypothetical protein Q8R10_00970 [Pseudomonas sp.]|uniref:hypothetical protein n=1 Tax=Pseudomonas sp. TaxID=306 RepID=UPI0027325CA6|nr:hypothetical protein [Pseudomonas sp.]MDP3844986.1 hypothetical protein [Pseudomonas sp.]